MVAEPRNPTATIKLLTHVIKDLFWLPVWKDGRKQTFGPDGRSTHTHTHELVQCTHTWNSHSDFLLRETGLVAKD